MDKHRNKTALLVMAAGMGSRYGGIKQLDPVGLSGETILEFGLFDAIRAGFDTLVFIIRKEIEADFRRLIVDRINWPVPIHLVFQEIDCLPAPWSTAPSTLNRTKPWGTAHAVWCARQAIDCPFAVINADDFYGRRSFGLLHNWLAAAAAQSSDWVMAGYQLKNTLSENGTVSRGICSQGSDGRLTGIEEHSTLAADAPGERVVSLLPDGTRQFFKPQTLVSMNMFGFTPGFFAEIDQRLEAFLRTRGSEPKAEFYLPAVVAAALADGHGTVQVLETPETWFGVTYKEDRAMVMDRIRNLIERGVYPRNLWGKA